MRANKMTNEELANLIEEGCGTSLMGHAVREAASRLRNATVREMAHRAAVEAYRSEVKDLNSKRQATIRDLRRKLKVAEDALKAAIGTSCAGCKQDCDGCLNLKNGWMKDAKKALAAIREEEDNNDNENK